MSVHAQHCSPNSHTFENPKHCLRSQASRENQRCLLTFPLEIYLPNFTTSLLPQHHTHRASSEITVTLSFVTQTTNISNGKLHVKSRATQHPVNKINHHRSSDYSWSHHKSSHHSLSELLELTCMSDASVS